MAKSPAYSGPVTKHQELAQTGHAEGYAKGGSVSSSKSHSGHPSMKDHHVGHGAHGHKHAHEHHTNPGGGHSGHTGDTVHSFVHAEKSGSHGTYTEETGTSGGGKHKGAGGTGGTRNPV